LVLRRKLGLGAGAAARFVKARAQEIMRICNENGWQVIVGIEPDQPENISDVKELLNRRRMEPTTYNSKPAKVGRNDYCPCGSGLKYKNCCLGMKAAED